MSYVVFWKCTEAYGAETFKINLTVYDKDLLQVLKMLSNVILFSTF